MSDANPKPRDRWPNWLGVLLFILLHLALTTGWLAAAVVDSKQGGKSPAVTVLFWVLEFPLAVLDKCGQPVPLVLLLPNSLLYGIVWWFMWRMARLTFSRKPAE